LFSYNNLVQRGKARPDNGEGVRPIGRGLYMELARLI